MLAALLLNASCCLVPHHSCIPCCHQTDCIVRLFNIIALKAALQFLLSFLLSHLKHFKTTFLFPLFFSGHPSQTFLNPHSPCWALLRVSHSGRVSEYQPVFPSHLSFYEMLYMHEFTRRPVYNHCIVPPPQPWEKFLHERFASDSNRPRGSRLPPEEGLRNWSVNPFSKDVTYVFIYIYRRNPILILIAGNIF